MAYNLCERCGCKAEPLIHCRNMAVISQSVIAERIDLIFLHFSPEQMWALLSVQQLADNLLIIKPITLH